MKIIRKFIKKQKHLIKLFCLVYRVSFTEIRTGVLQKHILSVYTLEVPHRDH